MYCLTVLMTLQTQDFVAQQISINIGFRVDCVSFSWNAENASTILPFFDILMLKKKEDKKLKVFDKYWKFDICCLTVLITLQIQDFVAQQISINIWFRAHRYSFLKCRTMLYQFFFILILFNVKQEISRDKKNLQLLKSFFHIYKLSIQKNIKKFHFKHYHWVIY